MGSKVHRQVSCFLAAHCALASSLNFSLVAAECVRLKLAAAIFTFASSE